MIQAHETTIYGIKYKRTPTCTVRLRRRVKHAPAGGLSKTTITVASICFHLTGISVVPHCIDAIDESCHDYDSNSDQGDGWICAQSRCCPNSCRVVGYLNPTLGQRPYCIIEGRGLAIFGYGQEHWPKM